MKDDGRVIVTRHTTLERISHYINIISLLALAVTGFVVYLGMPYMEYDTAFSIHVIAAAAFMSVNWIVVPYSAIMNRGLGGYLFLHHDLRRLIEAVKSFLMKGKNYPRYSIYDQRKGKFVNKLHPGMKLLVYSHYLALFFASLTGIVLYSTSLSLLGFNISGVLIGVLDFISPTFQMSGLGLAKVLHVAAGYWFVIEVVVHVGLIQLDRRKFQHIRSIFVDGKEDILQDPTADIRDTTEE